MTAPESEAVRGDSWTMPSRATIRVLGVGGAGCNAAANMIRAGLEGAEVVACNTDVKSLGRHPATRQVHLGPTTTRGLGAGARPAVGRRAAEEVCEELASVVRGSDLVFIAAGMGGGTGTGAAPVVAEVAREEGALVVAVVSRPFGFEGRRRAAHALAGIEQLREAADTVIVIPNQHLLSELPPKVSMLEAFRRADEVLLHAVQSIVEVIQQPGYINVDFADARRVLQDAGTAVIATGTASEGDRGAAAVESALRCPLLEDTSIRGATGLLVNLTVPRSFSAQELDGALERLRCEAATDALITTGVAFAESSSARATIIATGMAQARSR